MQRVLDRSSRDARMLSWWNKTSPTAPTKLHPEGSEGTLNSTPSLKASAAIHPNSVNLPNMLHEQDQHVTSKGTSEPTTELTTAPATDRAAAEEEMRGTFQLNWAFPKPLPSTQSFDQDVVRVWSFNAPPARRQPTAREHAMELLQALERQP